MITWGEDGRITEFAVMVRPVKALHTLMELMAAELFRSRLQGQADAGLVEATCPTAARRARRPGRTG